MSSWSFRKVTIDPVKDTDPIRIVSAVANSVNPDMSGVCSHSVMATRPAAPPPTPLSRATSWGIWVIFTRRAATAPTAEPTTTAARMIPRRFSSIPDRKSVTVARAAPNAPIRLPRRAVLGDDRPLSARMKQTAATR